MRHLQDVNSVSGLIVVVVVVGVVVAGVPLQVSTTTEQLVVLVHE